MSIFFMFFRIFFSLVIISCIPKKDAKTLSYKKVNHIGYKSDRSSPDEYYCNAPGLAFDLDVGKAPGYEHFMPVFLKHCEKHKNQDIGIASLERNYICNANLLSECLFQNRIYHLIPREITAQFNMSACQELRFHNMCPLCPEEPNSTRTVATTTYVAGPDFCRKAYYKGCENVVPDDLFVQLCYVKPLSTESNKLEVAYVGPLGEMKNRAIRVFTATDPDSGLSQPSDCLSAVKEENGQEIPVCQVISGPFAPVRGGVAAVQAVAGLPVQAAARFKRRMDRLGVRIHQGVFGYTEGPVEARKPGLVGMFSQDRRCRQLREEYRVFTSEADLNDFVRGKPIKFMILPKYSFINISETTPLYYKFRVVLLPDDYQGEIQVQSKEYYGIVKDLVTDIYTPKSCEM